MGWKNCLICQKHSETDFRFFLLIHASEFQLELKKELDLLYPGIVAHATLSPLQSLLRKLTLIQKEQIIVLFLLVTEIQEWWLRTFGKVFLIVPILWFKICLI